MEAEHPPQDPPHEEVLAEGQQEQANETDIEIAVRRAIAGNGIGGTEKELQLREPRKIRESDG
jgi:hypothetical protein